MGWLAAALIARRVAGLPPFAVLSCDNVRDNGRSLRRLAIDYARRVYPHAAGWLEDQGAFPNTMMVDRIVPRTTSQDLADARAAHGFEDGAAVRGEPFMQWVIEDFAAVRPPWEIAGAQFVADVRPFEDAKLRLLNAAHTAFAVFGVLLGYATIAQAAADADLAGYVRALLAHELAPTIRLAPTLDCAEYQRRLWPRFGNAAPGHGTLQVAADTSLKLTQRHLPALRERRVQGQAIDRLALLIAGWLRFLAGRREDGSGYPIDDPRSAQLAPIAAFQGHDAEACARPMLGVDAAFGTLATDAAVVASVARQLARLRDLGVRDALRSPDARDATAA